jgi:hypothetical protein
MVSSEFSWINQDSAAVDTSGKAVILSRGPGGADSLRLRAKAISLPAPYQVTAVVVADVPFENYASAGIWIGESGLTPKVHTLVCGVSTQPAFRGYRFSTPVNYAGNSDFTAQRTSFHAPVWLRIRNDNTNLILSASHNGKVFQQLASVLKNVFLANISQWGIVVNPGTATVNMVSMTVLSWQEE